MISYWPFSTKALFVQVRFVMLMHIPSIFSIYQIQTRSVGGLTGSLPTELHDSFSLVLGKMEGLPPPTEKKKKAQKSVCWGNRVRTPGMLSLLELAGPERKMSQQDKKKGELLRATHFSNWYLSIDQHISKKQNRAGGKKRGGGGIPLCSTRNSSCDHHLEWKYILIYAPQSRILRKWE